MPSIRYSGAGWILFLLLASAVLLAPFSVSLADWRADLTTLLDEEDADRAEKLIKKVVAASPDARELAQFLQNIPLPPAENTGTLLEKSALCSQGIERPF